MRTKERLAAVIASVTSGGINEPPSVVNVPAALTMGEIPKHS